MQPENQNFVMVPESRYQYFLSLEQAAKLKKPMPEGTADPLFNVQQLRVYLFEKTAKQLATQTIYDLVCKRKIPFKKFQKYLYFQKSAIDKWLNNGRQIL
jgi:hypothetical protein